MAVSAWNLLTALGPMTLAAWREQPASGVAFVVGFYALLVGAKIAVQATGVLANDLDPAPVLDDIRELAAEARVLVREVSRNRLDGEARTDAPQGVLARAATLASGRAMRGRLWAEAKALAGLAESYQRMAERLKGRPVAIADFDPEEAALGTLLEIVGSRERMDARFRIDPDDPRDPELAGPLSKRWRWPRATVAKTAPTRCTT